MKLYKIDFKNMVGQNCMTVPTDSQFLIGLSNGDADSTASLYDGATEYTAETGKVGEYTVFRMETGAEPSVKELQGVFTGEGYTQKVSIRLTASNSSVAYRDLEGTEPPTPAEIIDIVEESGLFQEKIGPIAKEIPESTYTIDEDTFSTLERKVLVIGQASEDDTLKTATINVDLDSFEAEPLFKVNFIIQCASTAVSSPDSLFAINLVGGNETIKTLSPDDFGIDGQVGITTLATMIGDNTGTALLAELTFGLTDAFACTKGHSYLPEEDESGI